MKTVNYLTDKNEIIVLPYAYSFYIHKHLFSVAGIDRYITISHATGLKVADSLADYPTLSELKTRETLRLHTNTNFWWWELRGKDLCKALGLAYPVNELAGYGVRST